MPYKWSKKYPTTVRILLAIVATAIDMAVCCASGVVMIFTMYFFNGLTTKNLMEYGPSVMTECAVQHCYSSKFLTYERYAKFNKRSSKFVAFICYYGYIWTSAYISIHVTHAILEFVWDSKVVNANLFDATGTDLGAKRLFQNPIATLIALHQVITFVVLTSHNSWFKGKLLDGVDPFAGSVIQCVVTWVIFSLYAMNFIQLDNLGQIGGFIQFIPLTNLLNVSIFHDFELSKNMRFRNLGTRGGYLCLLTNLVNIICWLVCLGIMYGLYSKEWDNGKLPNGEIGHGIWSMAAISWLPFQILGMRLRPVIYKKMCVKKDGYVNWGMIVVYFFMMLALAVGVGTVFYIFFNRCMWDHLICRVFRYKDNEGVCVTIPWHARPAFFFGFGIGTQYICYVETKELSKDNEEEEEEGKGESAPARKHVEISVTHVDA